MGTLSVLSSLCTSLFSVSTAMWSKVAKTVSEKQLLRNNSAARQSIQLWELSSTSLLLISPGLSEGGCDFVCYVDPVFSVCQCWVLQINPLVSAVKTSVLATLCEFVLLCPALRSLFFHFSFRLSFRNGRKQGSLCCIGVNSVLVC